MKQLFTLIITLLCIGGASAQDYNLISGHNIPVRLTTAVDSGNRIHSTPAAIVDANIADTNGNILIRRGTPVVLGTETLSNRGLGKPGSIKIDCLTTTSVDGQTIYLQGGISAVGNDREGLAIGLGIGAGIVVFPFGLFCLCIKGEDAYIPSNTMMTNIVVDDNYLIQY